MKVDGHTIEQDVIDKAVVWACTQIHFTYSALQNVLIRSRVDVSCAYAATDRLLQKWKKEGKIIFRKGQWHWQGNKN